MKTTAVVLDFCSISVDMQEYIGWIRRKTGADHVVALISGNFTHAGFPAEQDKYKSAEMLTKAGVDLVLDLPVYSTWMTLDGMAFAAVALLEKTKCMDELVLPCTSGDGEFLQKLVMYLFTEPLEYQKAFRSFRAQGCSISKAQELALEACIPGAGAFIREPLNAFFLEMAKALKKMYSAIKPVFLDITEQFDVAVLSTERSGLSRKQDLELGRRIREKLEGLSHAQALKFLNDIYGGFQSYSEHLLELLEDTAGEVSYLTLSEKLHTDKRSVEDMRRYLLRMLLEFRGMDNSICGLYTYVLYIRVLGYAKGAKALLEKLQSLAWEPVLVEEKEEQAEDNIRSLDEECKEMIAAFDRKAYRLYQEIMGTDE